MKSTNGNLVMTLFDDFAELKNDYDSAVIGAAVIKKLVAIDAFIEELGTKEITVTEDGFIATADFTVDGNGKPSLDSYNPIIPGRRGVFVLMVAYSTTLLFMVP